MRKELRIGVDTGGTFTDFVIHKEGKLIVKKIPSVPKDPSIAILEGILEFLNDSHLLMIIHGSTVATNALLERKGAKIALITSKGFEDIIFIGRQVRKGLYSLKGEKREPILSSQLCFGLNERTSVEGKVERKVSFQELKSLLEKIKKSRAEAVAVSLINSYANSTNEKIIEIELRRRKIMASISSSILPEYREFERTATTAVNAYLMPVISTYLSNLEKKIQKADLRIMLSNEGYIHPSQAKLEPIRTALSGPAGGVVGASRLAGLAGFKNIITFDMGGTSTDVSLVDGEIRRTNESIIGDFPVRIPIIDIHTVGAGGGSIAYVDRGGSLRVGPQSAGAVPGPACYGQGNQLTVTDANLALGRLDPDYFLGGTMKIYPERGLKALEKLAEKINKSILETAAGIIEIANANMEKAIRVISIERGVDPRNFALFSFGGAGGMHAAEISSRLKIGKIIVPKNAGVLSALGLLLADSIKDYSKSILKTTENIRENDLEKHFEKLIKKGIKDIKSDGFREENIFIYPFLDLRYLGQSYEITLPYKKPRMRGASFSFIADFHSAHRKLYSYYHPQRPVEVVNIRIKAVGRSKKIRIKRLAQIKKDLKRAFLKKQLIYYAGRKYVASIFDRSLLGPGHIIKGPALIVDYESTTFLPPSFLSKVDNMLNLIIQKE
ncbi:MAG: hydantoinase/oxoprolinase family protein [Candidatus Aminicenantaceae bacterium]